MRRAGMSLLVMCLTGGCDDNRKKQETAEQQEAKKRIADQSDRFRAEREAENQLMADLSTATPEIEKRLVDWITVRDGLFLVRGDWSSSRRPTQGSVPWHSMPLTTPWFVSCGHGITVTLGPWYDVRGSADDIRAESNFGLQLSNARLNEQQCKELVVVVGRKLRAMSAEKF